MGPVISQEISATLLQAHQDLIERGGRPILPLSADTERSAILSPGIIDVTSVADRVDEEWFGPLLQVIRVENFDAAIGEANRTAYGLSAALFSDDTELYQRFFRRIRAGVVNWNRQKVGQVFRWDTEITSTDDDRGT